MAYASRPTLSIRREFSSWIASRALDNNKVTQRKTVGERAQG